MRYAIKVAYDGSRFHGSQRQGSEDNGSVEGVIVNALKNMGEYDDNDPWPVEFSSRTDAGVSALGNVFSVRSELSADDLMRALNFRMNGVWCIAGGKMRDAQNIRWANSRWYRYHLPPGEIPPEGIKPLSETLSMFMGSHDFSYFSRIEGRKDPEVLIERSTAMDLTGNGEMIVCDIVGSRFLRHQVRRMVGAAVAVAKGEIEMEQVQAMLNRKSDHRDRVATMSPVGLVLMDVVFKDIEFVIDRKAVAVSRKNNRDEAWKASMRVILDSAMRSIL